MLNVRTVTVSDKGQIAIPADVREQAGIKQGDTLLIIQEDKGVLLQKTEQLGKKARDEFAHLLKHSDNVAKKFWGTSADDVWDAV